MSVVGPKRDPDTVAALHDIAWRVASAESSRTDGLDRKAATLATFVSLLATLTATLGIRFVGEYASWWAVALFCMALATLSASVVVAARALEPTEHLGLGSGYLRQLPSWRYLSSGPDQAQGEATAGLVYAVIRERAANDGKAQRIRLALRLMIAGLVLIGVEAATLAARQTL